MVQTCSRCLMDSSILGIRFDDKGVCNFCKIHEEWNEQFQLNEENKQKLENLIEDIKKDGRNKRYDCIIGVSGGTDSTYTLYLAKKFGLRPLAVHFDNGWDTEVAVSNIKKATEKLNIDFYTYVVDWEEFKDIQIAFLKASVPDVEIQTDIAIKGMVYRVAKNNNVKYIITGADFRTEGKIPLGWTYMDGKYIKSVHKKFGKKKLKTFPNFTLYDRFYYTFIKKIKLRSILDLVDYNKEEARKIIEKELGWKSYGGKHYESVYTRFIQSYLLPKKFNIDKRIVHYSALIRSGQMNREEALYKLKNESPYPEDKIKEDKDYVIKKLGLSKEEFEKILAQPPKTFLDYPTYFPLISSLKKPLKLIYRTISTAPPTIFDEMTLFEEDMKKNSQKGMFNF
jgi:N-acetyl sugar amidotransferase